MYKEDTCLILSEVGLETGLAFLTLTLRLLFSVPAVSYPSPICHQEARNKESQNCIWHFSPWLINYLYNCIGSSKPIRHTTSIPRRPNEVAVHLQLFFDGLCVVTHVFALVSQVTTNPGIISGLRSEYCIACCDPAELTTHTQESVLRHFHTLTSKTRPSSDDER